VTRIGELGTTLAKTCNRRMLWRNTKCVCSLHRLLVTASVFPSSPIFLTLMKEALSSSETSVLTRVTRHNIPEDVILHRSFSSYIWTTSKFRCLKILMISSDMITHETQTWNNILFHKQLSVKNMPLNVWNVLWYWLIWTGQIWQKFEK
jgi:hypothetical protein